MGNHKGLPLHQEGLAGVKFYLIFYFCVVNNHLLIDF